MVIGAGRADEAAIEGVQRNEGRFGGNRELGGNGLNRDVFSHQNNHPHSRAVLMNYSQAIHRLTVQPRRVVEMVQKRKDEVQTAEKGHCLPYEDQQDFSLLRYGNHTGQEHVKVAA